MVSMRSDVGATRGSPSGWRSARRGSSVRNAPGGPGGPGAAPAPAHRPGRVKGRDHGGPGGGRLGPRTCEEVPVPRKRQPPRGRRPAPRPARGAPAGTPRRRRPPAAQRPLPRAQTWYTPGASPLRRSVERASAPLLVYLHRLPRLLVALAQLALLLLGVLLPPVVALVPLALFVAFVGWLGYISWPAVSTAQRALRVGVVVAVALAAALRLTTA